MNGYKILSAHEIESINGGFAFMPFIIGSAINLIVYTINKKVFKHEEITLEGACLSAATGAFTGGVGSICVKAAGAGVAGNVAWRPGFAAINGAGQAIAAEK